MNLSTNSEINTMIRRVPELLLYEAHCNADGIGEGHFDVEKTDPYSTDRYIRGIQTVHKYIDCGWGLVIDIGNGVAKEEKDAKTLISFAEQNIPGAGGIIKLLHSNHGRIVFDRKVRFEGFVMDQTEELIEKLKDSDYQRKHNIPDFMWKRSFRSGFLW